MNTAKEVWVKILDVLSQQLTPNTIDTWLQCCTPVEFDNCRLVLRVNSTVKQEIIQTCFSDRIKAALYDLFTNNYDLVLLAEEEMHDAAAILNGNGFPPVLSDYTFDNFVVGNSNRFAHATATAVSENPGKTYNPLFIYGNSGLGKTHLLMAIANAANELFPQKRIVYIKAEEFTNQFVRAIKNGKHEELQNKYRNVDLFLVDNIQFVSGKQQTQNEFLYVFNTIFEAGNQIVISSDRSPLEMPTLGDQLRTRFECGLMADIQPPDLETRMAILRKKAAHLGIVLSDDAILYIVDNITSDIRKLEGVVKKLAAYKGHLDEDINIALVKKVVQDVI